MRVYGIVLGCFVVITSGQEDYQPFRGVRHDTFDWELSKAIFESDPGNVVCSPFLVKTVLLLLAEASVLNSTTIDQLQRIYPELRVPNEAREIYKNISHSLLNIDGATTIKNGIKFLVQNGVNPRPRYQQYLKAYYDTQVESVNFTESDEVVTMVNQWASQLTNNKLQNLINEADVQDAVLLLLNAIFFKGIWAKPFDANKTTTEYFSSSNGSVEVEFLTDEDKYYILQSKQLGANILRIPYSDGKLAMFIILPKEDSYIYELISRLDGLGRIPWKFGEDDVKVKLPKFKIKSELDLKDSLQSLGIRDIFTENAAFALLDKPQNGRDFHLKVSDIKQKAGIKVDEEGSEVYAATVAKIVNKLDKGTIEFFATRPFLFFIEDQTTGTILFTGKVMDPTALN